MNKSLKYLFTFVFVLLISSTSIAQKKEISEEQKVKMKAQLTEYFEKLNLSETQKPKFKEITKKYAIQMKDLKDSDKGRLSKYKEYKSIKKAKNKEMKTLLSQDQYDIYEEIQKEMQQKMKEKRKEKS